MIAPTSILFEVCTVAFCELIVFVYLLFEIVICYAQAGILVLKCNYALHRIRQLDLENCELLAEQREVILEHRRRAVFADELVYQRERVHGHSDFLANATVHRAPANGVDLTQPRGPRLRVERFVRPFDCRRPPSCLRLPLMPTECYDDAGNPSNTPCTL